MFYLDTNTNKRYRIGTPFTYDGKQYTRGGASHNTFMSLGFTQVLIQQRPDDQYYVVSGPDNTGAYSSTPRSLADLKLNFKVQQKKQAHNTLRTTDWYIIRSDELGAATASVPTAVLAFRGATRTAADTRCAEIDSCQTVEELEALMKAPTELYNVQTDTYSVNPAALTAWPEPLAETYNYYS